MKVVRICEKSKKLAGMFMRLQEFYESPEFRSKIFTRKEFLEWYKPRGKSYADDWAGYNLPGWVIEVFRHGCFDPLSKDEKKLLELCEEFHGAFYVIGTENESDDVSVLKHEMAHALFYLSDSYREEATKIINKLPKVTLFKMKKWLASTGYHEKAFTDELQAYIVSDQPAKSTNNAHVRLNLLYCMHVDDIIFIDRS